MFITLAFTIAGGMLAVLATARVEQIAWKFVRLVGVLVLAVTAAAAAWIVREQGSGHVILPALSAVAAAALIAIAPLAPSRPRATRALSAAGALAGLAAAAMAAHAGFQGKTPNAASLMTTMLAAAQVLSALMLGSITLAWLLGHAYLTATSMTVAPLRHFSRMLSWTVAARAAFFCVSLALAWRTSDASIFSRLADAWLIAFLRVGVGLVAVGVFAYMVSDCVARRATQSATGILYFASVMAYVGELAGQQLTREIGWPL